MSSISYTLDEQKACDLKERDERDDDFSSFSDLKRALRTYWDEFTCPSCGSHRVRGHGVIVQYGRIDFYREVSHKGFFGGTHFRDECYKKAWRIYSTGLRPGKQGIVLSLFGEDPGALECQAKGCGWKTTAPVYPRQSNIQWYSVNDIIQGKPFKS